MAPQIEENIEEDAIEYSKQDTNEYPIIPELLMFPEVCFDFHSVVTIQKSDNKIISVETRTWNNMPFELYVERAAQYIIPEHFPTFQRYWPCMQHKVALLFNIRCVRSKKLIPLCNLLLYRLRRTAEESKEAYHMNYKQFVSRREEKHRTEIRLAIKHNKQMLPSLQNPKTLDIKRRKFMDNKKRANANHNGTTMVNTIDTQGSNMASYDSDSRDMNSVGTSIIANSALNSGMSAQMLPEAAVPPVVQPLTTHTTNIITKPRKAKNAVSKESKPPGGPFYNSYGFEVSKPPAHNAEDPESYLSMPEVTYCVSLEDVISDMMQRKNRMSSYDRLNDPDNSRKELIESQPIDTVLYHVFLPNAVFIDEDGFERECNNLYQLRYELYKFIKLVRDVYDIRLTKTIRPHTNCVNLICHSQKMNAQRFNPSYSESDNIKSTGNAVVCSCRGLVSIKYKERVLALRVRHKHHQYIRCTKSLQNK